VQEEDKEIFVCIDTKVFRQITIKNSGTIEVSKFRSSGHLAKVWYNNGTTKEHWTNTVKSIKEQFSKF